MIRNLHTNSYEKYESVIPLPSKIKTMSIPLLTKTHISEISWYRILQLQKNKCSYCSRNRFQI